MASFLSVTLCYTHVLCNRYSREHTILLSVCRWARESSVWPTRFDGSINLSPLGSSSSLCRKRCCLCITCGSVWCRCMRRTVCVGMALPPLRSASAGLGEQDTRCFHSEFPGRVSLCRRCSRMKGVSCSGRYGMHSTLGGREDLGKTLGSTP